MPWQLLVLHEGRVLLGKVRVYSTEVGLSCSTHNPPPVHPHPRGVAAWAGQSPDTATRAVTTPSTTICENWSRSAPAPAIPNLPPYQRVAANRADRELRSPSRTYFSPKRLRPVPSGLQDIAVLVGEVRPRSRAAGAKDPNLQVPARIPSAPSPTSPIRWTSARPSLTGAGSRSRRPALAGNSTPSPARSRPQEPAATDRRAKRPHAMGHGALRNISGERLMRNRAAAR